MIRFGRELCGDYAAASAREWLETNGIGGFASSTVAGVNTRRYHGLLTAALKPPVGRHVLLSKLEETLVLDGRRFDLSTNCYEPSVVHPEGYKLLREFRLDPFPIFVFAIEDMEIEKSVFMIQGENSVVIRYEWRLRGTRQAAMEIRPLIAFRDFHATTHENGVLDPSVEQEPGRLRVSPYEGLPTLHFTHDAASVDLTGSWYSNFRYERELERGLDCVEDLYNPFTLYFHLTGSSSASIAASASNAASAPARRPPARATATDLRTALSSAAEQFLVRRRSRASVIAGYHWFAEWGRDTMIALPGLTLATGRKDLARDILLEYAGSIDRGMIPNRFPDQGERPEYNTADATLWYFEAIRALNDVEFVRQYLYDQLREIVGWHERGARFGIRVDADGLLAAGEPGVQLTWMDAKVGDWVITPRSGKPVEVQALWYNALRIMEDFARAFGDNAGRYAEMAEAAARSFDALFWNEQAGCLYDVVDGESRDGRIRPNQILAVSLFYTMLDADRARQVVGVVERELLTPRGLRSLSPSDPDYRGRYEGDVWSRDSAYHQGTVWPWLMGPFITAYLRTQGEQGRAQAKRWIEGFEPHLLEAGLGQISEIFDGDFPHAPRGAIAQAWSVAELLRALILVESALH